MSGGFFPSTGGSTPNLSAVLAVGADANGTDITNAGSYTLTGGRIIDITSGSLKTSLASASSDTIGVTPPLGWIRVTVGDTDVSIPGYQPGA